MNQQIQWAIRQGGGDLALISKAGKRPHTLIIKPRGEHIHYELIFLEKKTYAWRETLIDRLTKEIGN